MDFSAIFHGFSTWLFRIVIVGAAVAIGYIYMNRDNALPGAQTAAESTAPAACQPIGHTANDELVYSMDCEQLPAPAIAGAAANAASK